MAQVHDYTTDQKGKGVELIVRPKNKYGIALAGERVLVDEVEMKNPALRAACMTAVEAEELKRDLAAARADAETKKAGKRTLMKMVDAGLEQQEKLAAVATGKAKKKAKDEAIEAEQIEARNLAREAAEE